MFRVAGSLWILALFTLPAPAAYDFDEDWYETGEVGIGWGAAATTVGDVNGDGYSDILVGSPQFGGSPFWSKGKISLYYGSSAGPSSAPGWEFAQNLAFLQLGWSIAPAGDMNADGFADFVVGAPGYSNGHSEEGRLYFFMGSANGPVSWTQAEINEEDARLGHCVAYAGDVNGDGYDDIIAGAPGWGGFGSPFYIPVQGRAYVYYGGAAGPDNTSDWNRSGGDANGDFGWDVAGLGDVNGDGFADVMVGKPHYDPGVIDTNHGAIYCYYGSASGLSSSLDWTQVGAHAGDEFGKEMAFAGDFNGDGFADALIGVPDYNSGWGGLYIASGGPSGLGAAALWQSGYSSSWGGTVSTIGDFNGDGRTDFAVGGGVDDDAYVYFGSSVISLERRIVGTQQFATTIASAGDVNGDGLGDFLVVDPLDQLGAGSIRLYLGGQEINYSVPQLLSRSGGNSDELGRSIADAGDVNGDGIGDLLVGAPGKNAMGEIQLYYGNIYTISATPDWTATGSASGSRLGAAVASAGDVNGDGYADIVATDPNFLEVRVYHGSPTGPGTAPDWTHVYPHPGAGFGTAVSGGGDINGDGYADIAVGAPSHDNGRGRVRIFFGSPTGIRTVGALDLNPANPDDWFGTDLAIFGDGNGDGFDDLAVGAPGNQGAVFIHYGASDGFWGTSTTFSGLGGQLGAAVAAAGDVNGDGFADVIAGEPYSDAGATESGEAHVLLGNSPTVDTRIRFDPGPLADLHFGQDVAGLGDPDGAGRSLVAVSAWDAGSQLGIVRVYEHLVSVGTMVTRSAFEIFYPQDGMQIHGVGDLDGDGSGELGFGLPVLNGADGEILVHGPFPARASLPPSARPELTRTNGDPIALRGLAASGSDLRFAVRAWLPAGRTRLNLEWNLGEERSPYSQTGTGAWTPSATHIGGTDLFVDPALTLVDGQRYRWRLRVLSSNPYVPWGPWMTSQPNTDTLYSLRVVDTVTAVEDMIPRAGGRLASAAPNPFNPSTLLEFRIGERGPVSLEVFDSAGRLVRTLYRGDLEPGVHHVRWDGTDDGGRLVASGVYHALLQGGGQRSRLKLALVK